MYGNVFVFTEVDGKVVDVQYVPEFQVPDILEHVEQHQADGLDVRVTIRQSVMP